ncbi:MAG: PqiC family protein [Sulfuritalea sp.]|nr:PqiC family protein [Sulfuritalea sp.]
MKSCRFPVAALILLVALVGCAAPGKTHYLTLFVAPAAQATAASGAVDYRVAIGPATVPDVLDRPQIVLSARPGHHEFSDAENWSAPLKREIPRVLAEVVGQRLSKAHVKAYSQHGGQDADFGVLIDVLRFESRPGDSITLEVVWTVRGRDGKRLHEARSVEVENVVAVGTASIVSAHAKALVALGQEIAGVVASLAEAKR